MNFRLFLETIDLSHIDQDEIIKRAIDNMDWSGGDGEGFRHYAKIDLYGDPYYDGDDVDEKEVEEKTLEIAKEELQDKLYDIIWQYEQFKDPLRLYREITVRGDSFEEIIKNIRLLGVGIFWSHSERTAEAHWGRFQPGYRKILLYAEVPAVSVNWEDTLMMNIQPSMIDEKEIRLREHAQVIIGGVKP